MLIGRSTKKHQRKIDCELCDGQNAPKAETPDHLVCRLHPVIVRSAATLGRHPGDDLIWIHDVARLAMHAVRWIEMDPLSIRRISGVDHFIYVRGAEVLTWTTVLLHAALIANIRVVND